MWNYGSVPHVTTVYVFSLHDMQKSSLLSDYNYAVHNVCMYTLQEASEPSSTTVDNHAEPFRAALDRSVQAYIKDHYPNGFVTVSVMTVPTLQTYIHK